MRRRWFSILCIISSGLFAATLLLEGRSFQETEGIYRLISDGSNTIRLNSVSFTRGQVELKRISWKFTLRWPGTTQIAPNPYDSGWCYERGANWFDNNWWRYGYNGPNFKIPGETGSDEFFSLWILLPITAILPGIWLLIHRRRENAGILSGAGSSDLDSAAPSLPGERQSSETLDGECFRCGYNLHGITDDQPCPECGLLAQRSRRRTDELHDTRPRWLRTLSRGIALVLLGIAAAFAWPFMTAPLQDNFASFQTNSLYASLGYYFAAVIVFLGVVLFTRPEGYAPADHADRRLRFWLRVFALMPLFILLLQSNDSGYRPYRPSGAEGLLLTLRVFASSPLSIVLVPLPFLMFLQLRGLAKRARSAHLAEHCVIVGIGASVVILYVEVMLLLLAHGDQWGLGDYWLERSQTAVGLAVSLAVLALLMVLWTLYLLIRFAHSFWRAAIQLRRKWSRDDLSAAVVSRG